MQVLRNRLWLGVDPARSVEDLALARAAWGPGALPEWPADSASVSAVLET